MTAALLAAAHLTPDSPLLPAMPPAAWADRRNHVWVEAPSRPGYLRVLSEHTGKPRRALWPAMTVFAYYGPLMEVTP